MIYIIVVPHHPIHVIVSIHFFSPTNWCQFNIESSNVPCLSIYSSYSLFYASHYVLEFPLYRSFILSIFWGGFCTHTFLIVFFFLWLLFSFRGTFLPRYGVFFVFVFLIPFTKNQDHGIWFHHFIANRWGKNGNSGIFYFLGLQNHCGQWLQSWN